MLLRIVECSRLAFRHSLCGREFQQIDVGKRRVAEHDAACGWPVKTSKSMIVVLPAPEGLSAR
jgi:hypothetical protein